MTMRRNYRSKRQHQRKRYSSDYDTDEKLIKWLQGIFELYAEVTDDIKEIGRVSASNIMDEAKGDNIDPSALERVVAKYEQFGTTGQEYWFTTKKPRAMIWNTAEPPKASSGGFFADQLKPLTEKQERSVMAQSRKMIAALED